MNQQSPMLRLWELGESQHGSLIRAMPARLGKPGLLMDHPPFHK